MSAHPTIVRVNGAAGLSLGESRLFPLPDSDDQGFLIRSAGGLRAFRNRCRHWPAPLDMDDGNFWNPSLQAIQCSLHGALYRAEDGFCTMGPCSGAHLESWPVEIVGQDALVTLPRG